VCTEQFQHITESNRENRAGEDQNLKDVQVVHILHSIAHFISLLIKWLCDEISTINLFK